MSERIFDILAFTSSSFFNTCKKQPIFISFHKQLYNMPRPRFLNFVMQLQPHWRSIIHKSNNIQQKFGYRSERKVSKGCITHFVALAFTLKGYLKAQRRIMKTQNISPCKKCSLQKNPQKETIILIQDIIITLLL